MKIRVGKKVTGEFSTIEEKDEIETCSYNFNAKSGMGKEEQAKLARYIMTALQNRKTTVESFYDRFIQEKEGSDSRFAIIKEMIELEPSHVEEPWIAKEITYWTRYGLHENLIQVFARKGDKEVLTNDDRFKKAKAFFLIYKIHEIMEKDKCSKAKAYKELANQQAKEPNPIYPQYNYETPNQQLELMLEKKYKEAKKLLRGKQELPRPYWGRDIFLDGDELIHRQRARVDFKGIPMFGDWELRIPINRKKFESSFFFNPAE